MDKPSLVVFAGPNGSGKSCLMGQFWEAGHLPVATYINTDEIALEILGKPFADASPEELLEANFKAAQQTKESRETLLEQKISFAMETVLSTSDKINFMRKAKTQGYEIFLFFVTTQNPIINISRVHNRVLLGGHNVAIEKIVSRHYKANYFLPEALEIADIARVFDNSSELAGPLLILSKKGPLEYSIYPLSTQGFDSIVWTQAELERIKADAISIHKTFHAINHIGSGRLVLSSDKNLAENAETTYLKAIFAALQQTAGVYLSYDYKKPESIINASDAEVFRLLKAQGLSQSQIHDCLLNSPCLIGKPKHESPVNHVIKTLRKHCR